MEDKRTRILEVLNYYKQELENKGYKVIYVALYGSQNYNVDDEKSDIDAKAIVLPSLKNIIHRECISAVLETEFGAVDYKDIITFNEIIRKGNFSYIEAVQSNYRIGELELIDRLFGDIEVNLKSILGGMLEKRKALTHEYPSKTEEFINFGCDPKQFHHIWRLHDLFFHLVSTNDNASFLRYNRKQKNFMISLKRKMAFPLEETLWLADHMVKTTKNFFDQEFPDYKYQPIDNIDLIDEYVEAEIQKELIRKGTK